MSLAEIIINQVSYPENRASDSLTRSYCFSHSPSSSVFCHIPETEVKWTCCSWNYLELSDLPWALASCPNCPLGPKARLFHSLSHLTCLLSQLTGGLPWGTFLVPPSPPPLGVNCLSSESLRGTPYWQSFEVRQKSCPLITSFTTSACFNLSGFGFSLWDRTNISITDLLQMLVRLFHVCNRNCREQWWRRASSSLDSVLVSQGERSWAWLGFSPTTECTSLVGGWVGLVTLLLAAYSTHSRVCTDTSKYLSFSNQGDGVSLSQEKIHKNKMMSKIT